MGVWRKIQCYFITAFFAAIVIIGLAFLWEYVVTSAVRAGIKNKEKSVVALRSEVNDLRNATSTSKASMFLLKYLRRPEQINKSLYHLLKKHSDVNLISLTEVPAKSTTVEKALGENLSSYSNAPLSRLKMTTFELKLYGEFLPLYNFLLAMKKTENSLLWQKIIIRTNQYPKVLLDLKFYIVGR